MWRVCVCRFFVFCLFDLMRSLHIKLFVVIEDIFLQNPGLGTFSNKTTTRQQPHIIIHHKQRERYYFNKHPQNHIILY